MSYQKYPSYKESGIHWLGEVPSHWSVAPLKRGFVVTLGKMLQPDAKGAEDELMPYLRAANIQWGGVETSDVKQMWLSARDRYQLDLQYGDLLVSEGGDVGRSCLWANEIENCSFQNSVNRVRAREANSTNFLRYWMSTIKDKGYVDVLCNKSTIAHFTAEKVAAVPVPFPPPHEQSLIETFLDVETEKIDELAKAFNGLIDLLKEKRQAVISHAVTKGLDSSAPMKDSGIDWLGEVPAHWRVMPFKRIVSTPITDGPHETPQFIDEGVPFISAEAVSSGKIDFAKIRACISEEDNARYSLKYTPKLHDIYMVKSGATTGVTAIVEGRTDFNIWSPLAAIRCNSSSVPHFVLHFMRSRHFMEAVTLNWSFGTQQNIGMGVIGSLACTVPPVQEQLAISKHLEIEVTRMDDLIKEALRAIDLLQERRTALISAAVTGKIDVRGLVEVVEEKESLETA